RLVMLAAQRPLLAIADRHQACRCDALRDEVVDGGFRASIAERQVVLFRSPFVAVPLDQHLSILVGAEPSRIRVEDLGVAGADRILVEIEMDVDEVPNTDEFAGSRPRTGRPRATPLIGGQRRRLRTTRRLGLRRTTTSRRARPSRRRSTMPALTRRSIS